MQYVKCISSQKNATTRCGHLIYQAHNIEVKWSVKPCIVRRKQVCKALRQKLVERIMKNSNLRESPISCDTLLIIDSESGVKQRVPKLLLECFMRKLHNDLIASLDDGVLLGAIHANKNYVIISDTMLHPLPPSQLRQITDHHKMICGCDICNTR